MRKRILCIALALTLLLYAIPFSVTAIAMTHQVVIVPQYEEVGRFNDGYAPVKVDGKWGYINEAGEIVVEPKYDCVGICNEGVALALLETSEDYEPGYTNSVYHIVYLVHMDGKCIPLYYDAEKEYPYKIGFYFDDEHNIDSFRDGASRWVCNDGVVNALGIPYTQSGERINVENPEEHIDYPRYCSFTQIAPCVNGIIPMLVTEPPTPRMDALLLSVDGQIIEYTRECSGYSPLWNSLRMARKAIMVESDDFWPEEMHLWGLMDADMNWLAEPQFTAYQYTTDGVLFHDNLMPVQVESGKWGAINTSGKVVIDAQYDAMSCFNNGFSCVMEDGKCFFIDTNGKSYTILDLQGNEGSVSLGSKVSNEGLAAVYDAKINKAYYVNLFAAHNGVVPAVAGSDALSLESYAETFGEDGTPESMAIPSSLVPVKEGTLWGIAKLSFAPPTIPFTDVSDGSFYYDSVLWAVEKDITKGVTDHTFNPDGDCTRGQVVTFLWRAAGSPEPTSTEHPFTDVKEGAFYYKAMLWAVENGITKGMTGTTFVPNNTCTRGQVVTFLYRADSN